MFFISTISPEYCRKSLSGAGKNSGHLLYWRWITGREVRHYEGYHDFFRRVVVQRQSGGGDGRKVLEAKIEELTAKIKKFVNEHEELRQHMNSTRAVQLDPCLRALYDRLITKGKRPKTARCACMRKLLTILRSMVVNNQPYEPQHFFQKRLKKIANPA